MSNDKAPDGDALVEAYQAPVITFSDMMDAIHSYLECIYDYSFGADKQGEIRLAINSIRMALAALQTQPAANTDLVERLDRCRRKALAGGVAPQVPYDWLKEAVDALSAMPSPAK